MAKYIHSELAKPVQTHIPNFDTEQLKPLRAVQAMQAMQAAQAIQAIQAAQEAQAEQTRKDAEAAAEAAKQAEIAAETVVTAPVSYTSTGSLTGSIGYASPYGNCVLQVPLSIRPDGNPITWIATTQTPYIGAVALFTYNHVGMVVGIWSNGDLEIAHQNFQGGQHRFPRSTFRGFR